MKTHLYWQWGVKRGTRTQTLSPTDSLLIKGTDKLRTREHTVAADYI